jgi:hypothetical protein
LLDLVLIGSESEPRQTEICKLTSALYVARFVYGGYNEITILRDVFVLSLPAFRWFRAPVEGTQRHIHKCIAAAPDARQMLVVGGIGPTFNSWTDVPTDEWAQGLGVFDMSALAWRQKFETGLERYAPAKVVQDFYDGGGLANVVWDSDAVKGIFNKGSTTNPPGGGGGNYTGTTNVGAIVGGVVGGLAALVAIGVFYLFLRRRQQNKTAELEATQQQQQFANQPMQHSPYHQPTEGAPRQGAWEYKPVTAELDPHSSPPAELPSTTPPQELPGDRAWSGR